MSMEIINKPLGNDGIQLNRCKIAEKNTQPVSTVPRW